MSKYKILLLFFLFQCYAITKVVSEWHDDAGPWVIATKGEPWPQPLVRTLKNEIFCLDPDSFYFKSVLNNCDILQSAIIRYKEMLFGNKLRIIEKASVHNRKENDGVSTNNTYVCKDFLFGLDINLEHACERYPNIYSDESYTLQISDMNGNAKLSAVSIWGILRGLETFSQLIIPADNGAKTMLIQEQNIIDYPRFHHRGLLLDTSRHYLPVEDILLTLDAMSYNKLNVFHWHIVDDNSFPYESVLFPELAKSGAYHPSMTYKASDVQKIIEYARLRGIRVIPEFDSPGHTKSWGLSHPELLTQCYDANGPTGKLGPMNPTYEPLYDFMKNLLIEVFQTFPDDYIHLGGDEVPFTCWQSNPQINSYMKHFNITGYEKLEEMYIQKIVDIVSNLKGKSIVWQEVFDNGVNIQKNTVVHVWTGNWRSELAAVTGKGYPAILSTCWYLDHIAGGGDWTKFYDCEPLDFHAAENEQKNLVIGGEACMWGEFVDRHNVHSRIWPRASAVAEKLWSQENLDKDMAAKRLEEHACRMNKRKIPAQPPNGPGFCIY